MTDNNSKMKVSIGKPSSVSDYVKERIVEISKEAVPHVCPVCKGSGKIMAPKSMDISDKVAWFWHKLSEALLLKPEGVELMLTGNVLCVIEEPKEEGVLNPENLRMIVPNSMIKYATSEVKYQVPEDTPLTEEMLQKQALKLDQKQ